MIIIDGSEGEGGGQILRTALTLSMLSGLAFRLEKIRGKRRKPGLLRQHLTCVRAAQQISSARVAGGELSSTKLTFEPAPCKAGAYSFAIGSAGSTALVFQTVLPALLAADAPSTVSLSGGTHNSSAPTFDYLVGAYLPLLARMGAAVDLSLVRPGFYPAGGGQWSATIAPLKQWQPLVLEDAGAVVTRRIVADVANVPYNVAEREAQAAAAALSWPVDMAQGRTVKAEGPGNVLSIHIVAEHVTEIFTAFGERGVSAETVATAAVDDVRAYLVAKAPVGPHLADQLLLPMALAGRGAFVTMAPTAHTRTNIRIIETFLPVEFEVVRIDDYRWRISVST